MFRKLQYYYSFLPGLCDILRAPCAVGCLYVAGADLGRTYTHEVRSWPANCVFGQVCERLTYRCPKQKGTHDLIKRSYILVEIRI